MKHAFVSWEGRTNPERGDLKKDAWLAEDGDDADLLGCLTQVPGGR